MNQKIQKFLLIITIPAIIGIAYYFSMTQKQTQKTANQEKSPLDGSPQYSFESKDISETKSKLVPNNFPILEPQDNPQEIKRTLNSLNEYIVSWKTLAQYKKVEGTYVQYASDNGWTPFINRIATSTVSITGEKNNIVLNIFITQENGDRTDIQANFSEKK